MDWPLHDKVGPKKRKDNDIGPDDDLDVVPFPGRQFYKVADKEDRDRRNGEGDGG